MLQPPVTDVVCKESVGIWSHLHTFAISTIAVFAPLKSVMFALLFLVSVDVITGIWAAIVTNKPLTSRRLARTIVKTFVYLTTICVVHVANKYLLSAGEFSLPLDTLIVGFIALTELKSILENLQKIQKQPLLQFVIDRIASDSSRALEQIEPEDKPEIQPKTKPKTPKEKKGGTSNRQK
jgi:phage-related holin